MPKHEDGGPSISSDLAVASMIGAPSGRNDVNRGAEGLVLRGLGPEQALKERHGFGEPARAGEARGFGHLARIKHVIHVESFLLLGNN